MELSFIVQGVILLLLMYFMFKPSKNTNFPPGPTLWFPLLGHLPLLGRQPHKRLMQWKSTYGPIVGLWFGNHRVIAITEPELIKEALNSPSLAGRPAMGVFRDWGLGLVLAEGQHHSDHRKFTLKQMKAYGFANAKTESKITYEVLNTLQDLKQYVGKPFSLDGTFEKSAGKIIWKFIMDEPVVEEVDHPLQTTLSRIANIFKENSRVIGILTFLPWLGTLFPGLSGFKRYQTFNKQIEKFIKDRVDVHNRSRKDTPRDFVDAYLEQVSKTQNPDSCFHPSRNSIIHLVKDLLIGASDTIGNSMTWLLAYLITWPEVQKMLQNEIDAVVGHERSASLNDRPQMPYTVAVIYEMLRFSSIFAILHKATKDVTFQGFYLPKGTIVIFNLYAAHFDKEIWGDPENFRPERFLDSSWTHVQRNENLMPFSVGKRACPGEAIAMDELFLFTVYFFQAFEVKAGAKLPCLEGHLGITRTPHPFEVILTARQK